MDNFDYSKKPSCKAQTSFRTDLAVESISGLQDEYNPLLGGIRQSVSENQGYTITHIEIVDEKGEKASGKPIGSYITIDMGDFKLPTGNFAVEVDVIAEEIKKLVANATKNILVIGLGNREITPDAIGPLAADNIFATRHIDKSLQEQTGLNGLACVSAIAPGVLGQTGVETAEIVKALVVELKPECVIVIDALAARSIERLATTVQLSDSGIIPGSGVQNARKALNKETLGIPVISIGVPMVVDIGTAAHELLGIEAENPCNNMMVTPREVDVAVEHSAKLVAFAINRALQPQLSLEDIMALVG